MTLNSPESMLALYHTAVASKDSAGPVGTAEFMREIGLKCICLNGVSILLPPQSYLDHV